jgi:hypothetical protein
MESFCARTAPELRRTSADTLTGPATIVIPGCKARSSSREVPTESPSSEGQYLWKTRESPLCRIFDDVVLCLVEVRKKRGPELVVRIEFEGALSNGKMTVIDRYL